MVCAIKKKKSQQPIVCLTFPTSTTDSTHAVHGLVLRYGAVVPVANVTILIVLVHESKLPV